MAQKTNVLVGAADALKNTDAIRKGLKGPELRLAMGPAGRILRDRARELAPFDPSREKGTHLRDAIFFDAREHGKEPGTILFGVNHKAAPHAHLFELGWSKKPEGQPYLRPAASEKREEVKQAIARGVQRIVMGFGRYSGGWET